MPLCAKKDRIEQLFSGNVNIISRCSPFIISTTTFESPSSMIRKCKRSFGWLPSAGLNDAAVNYLWSNGIISPFMYILASNRRADETSLYLLVAHVKQKGKIARKMPANYLGF